jgi:hypothetical protein
MPPFGAAVHKCECQIDSVVGILVAVSLAAEFSLRMESLRTLNAAR